jgi:hypothetical protein
MKKLIVLLILCLAGWSASNATPPPVGVSFGIFYSNLSPYGEWISVGTDLYGWRPHHVDVGWRPYTMGRWVWTDDGWYWSSDEPWGWAAYHYGRWYYDDYYGWVWIPGYDWAPAWVEWRYGGDYIGWAPLSPYAVFSASFGIHYRNHWVTPHHWWAFVDCGHVGAHDLHRYVYRNEDNDRYIGRTRDFGSVRYNGGRVVSRGPEREIIERRGNIRIDRADIVDVNDRQGERLVRGTDNRMKIETYRPRIAPSEGRSEAVRPSEVRSTGRPINLDSRGIDARSREEDLARGRDIRRTEQYRQLRETEMRQNATKNTDPSVRNSETKRPERTIERVPPARRENVDNNARIERDRQLRSPDPERTVRRPENRSAPSVRSATPQASPRSSDGGGSRSSGGSSRGGGNSRGEGHRR